MMKILPTKIILAACISLLTASCSILPFSDNSDRYRIKVKYGENTRVTFRNLRVIDDDEKVTLSGRLKSKFSTLASHGHIDIVVRSPTGELLEETTVHYTGSLNSRRLQRKGGSHFRKVLSIAPPEGSEIAVAFHKDNYRKPVIPSHDKNIAL